MEEIRETKKRGKERNVRTCSSLRAVYIYVKVALPDSGLLYEDNPWLFAFCINYDNWPTSKYFQSRYLLRRRFQKPYRQSPENSVKVSVYKSIICTFRFLLSNTGVRISLHGLRCAVHKVLTTFDSRKLELIDDSDSRKRATWPNIDRSIDRN